MKPNPKFKVFFISFIFIVFSLASIYLIFVVELDKKPILREKIESKDLKYIYNFYTDYLPSVDQEEIYGNEKAPITMIAYLDITSESSRYFIRNIFPKLNEDYISVGKLKYIPKVHLTMSDYEEKNNKYIIAASLICVKKIDGSKYFDFYFSLFNLTDLKELAGIIERRDISKEEFRNCLKEDHFEDFKEEISEAENLALIGLNQRFYIGIGKDIRTIDGVPEYDIFRRTIREYEIIIGY